MAVLPEGDRFTLWADLMRRGESYGTLVKPELRAAVDAVDAWIDANSASFNQAIPQPARGQLSGKQKALLLMVAVQRRHGIL